MKTEQKIMKKRAQINTINTILDALQWYEKRAVSELTEWVERVEANNGEISEYDSEEKIRIDAQLEVYNKLDKFLDDMV